MQTHPFSVTFMQRGEGWGPRKGWEPACICTLADPADWPGRNAPGVEGTHSAAVS